jgi:glucose-1-phosphate adenylyltransferase
MDNVLTMILAGGSPDALGVLGLHRAKTAVPFGGSYRLIDFPLSNCVNSGLRNIYILTQYNPRSLRRHIRLGRPWDLDRSREGGLRVLLPYSGARRTSWYRGTADALIQNLDIIRKSASRYVLILSGDHIYKMDYRELFHRHIITGASLTLATRPQRPGDARRFGLVSLEDSGRVNGFREKPGEPFGSDASLGIYLFDRDYLVDMLQRLEEEEGSDLVREIITPTVAKEQVFTYRYDGYWEDVGDLDAYYRANLMLVDGNPSLRLDDPAWPIFTRMESESPTWFAPNSAVERSIIGAGCRIAGRVSGSVIFPQVKIAEGAVVENAILFTGCHVEANATVGQAILDKKVQVGAGARVWGGDGLAILPKHHRVEAGGEEKGETARTEVGEGGRA